MRVRRTLCKTEAARSESLATARREANMSVGKEQAVKYTWGREKKT